MFRHLTKLLSLGAVFLLSSTIAQAQFGGLSLQLGGYGYGNPNYRNFGYGNSNYSNYGYNNSTYRNYYPSYRNNNNGYYSNNGYYNNNGFYNNRNGGYVYSSPNYYFAPQRAYPVQRFRRW